MRSNEKLELLPASLVSPSKRWMIVSAILGAYLFFDQFVFTSSVKSSRDCLISFGAYKGHIYTTTETIAKPKCLLESKWMRVQQHQVRFPGMKSAISDWLWIDYHDRINVLVEAPATGTGQRQFMVFEQTKYALEGRQSLAIIGGIIEPGEDPKTAAAREVQEEMGVECQKMHFLGRYRTDVNRGIGWVNSFLAVHCSKSNRSVNEKENTDVIGVSDVERQDLKRMSLTELKMAARKGEFLEVQWSNTVALALLHDELAGK
jgi:8-oxo-dGTP pyrophosphatase MutT (NUDIX family)